MAAYLCAFDYITTCDAIHDQAHLDRVLANIARAPQSDGVYLMQDIHGSSSHDGDRDHPVGPLLYIVSTLHCMTVSLAADGIGLGTLWGRATPRRMLGEAGFAQVRIERLVHDVQDALSAFTTGLRKGSESSMMRTRIR